MTLTVQQGIDDLRGTVGAASASEQLARRAQRIRSAIALRNGGGNTMFVGRGTRQRLYTAGNIAAREYARMRSPTSSSSTSISLPCFGFLTLPQAY